MKKIITKIITLLLVSSIGLAQDTLYMYQSGVEVSKRAVAQIDSVIFYNPTASIPTVSTYNFSNIKGTSAKAGGDVTNDGGSSVTSQGLCWSTSQNPTLIDNINTSFSNVISNLTPNTIYYVRAYAINAVGTGYGNQISFNSGRLIGSSYGGGLVFYNDGNGNGLTCSETDQSTGAGWGCSNGGTSYYINTGADNTNAIVAGCSTDSIAAKICYDLILNTYSDWFLPSREELDLMYENLFIQSLGNFSPAFYWSSSELTGFDAFQYGGGAWPIKFTHDGNLGSWELAKSNKYYVRAVRAF